MLGFRTISQKPSVVGHDDTGKRNLMLFFRGENIRG